MPDLFSAIPGLSALETPIPAVPAPVVVSFDNAAAQNIIREAIHEVACAYPSGSPWQWLVESRPDDVSELKKAGNDMNAAYLAADMEQVKARADRFIRLHKLAWQLYEERPPVIERQDPLFGGGA